MKFEIQTANIDQPRIFFVHFMPKDDLPFIKMDLRGLQCDQSLRSRTVHGTLLISQNLYNLTTKPQLKVLKKIMYRARGTYL